MGRASQLIWLRLHQNNFPFKTQQTYQFNLSTEARKISQKFNLFVPFQSEVKQFHF